MWVSPFRYLRIKGYLLLPAAFRSLSRLSSALSAKASTLRSFLLDLFLVPIALGTGPRHFRDFFSFFRTIAFFSDVLISEVSLLLFINSFCVKFSRYIPADSLISHQTAQSLEPSDH